MKQLHRDLWIYIGLALASAVFYFIIIPHQIVLRSSWSGDVVFTSRTFPKLLAVSMFGISLAGIAETVLKTRKYVKESDKKKYAGSGTGNWKGVFIVLLFFALIVVYSILFAKIGFIISALVIIPVFLFCLGSRKWYQYAVVYSFAAMLYIIFRFLLNVPLP